ncbi:MAG: hydantoinase B/oxoprolinase family protein [Pseudomonadota bacterium]
MGWHFWIDRGGTFTDVVARAPDGKMHVLKLLSEDPEQYDDAAIEAMRRLTGMATGPLPPATLRLGTTVATNALLERTGEPVLLAITAGLGDALLIGTQARPDIFARAIRKPVPLYARVVEIDERIGANGNIVTPLDEGAARDRLQDAYDGGLRAVAIVLMHGYRHHAHEAALARIATEIGFTQISVSHQVAPLIKLVPRGQTSVVDAYLSPVLDRYVSGLQRAAGGNVAALFMQSNGGLTPGATFNGKDAILSGPAGGIVGMAVVAERAGFDHVVGFDMGGTSTDVSHYAGTLERDGETEVAGVSVRTPMMRIHTVAAGGGSICAFDGTRFQVGPGSAGARPGPAAYGRGGPLTVTDCNLLLGKLQPDHFPHVFGPDSDAPLDPGAARAAMDAVLADVERRTGRGYTVEAAAEGFLTIAVQNMATAIKTISLRRGHDVTRASLVAFGGAGGQLACRVATALGMRRILCHPMASVLSAYGMGLADRRAVRDVTVGMALSPECRADMEEIIAAARAEADAELGDAGAGESIDRQTMLFIRPAGTESSIEVEYGSIADMRAAFAEGWARRFGFAAEGDLIVDRVRVETIAHQKDRHDARTALPTTSAPPVADTVMFADGTEHKAPLYRRDSLAAGFTTDGPALIVDDVTTIAVEPDWRAEIRDDGNLILTAASSASSQVERHARDDAETGPDPVRLEIMSALFMSIAEEMGAALQSSASSVNIRERLDFSCAVFDRHGNLIANAPHMPVHLGSMGESVRTIMASRGDARDGRGIRPGDAYALNSPYAGGTHLPDITVVMPVFADDTDDAPAWFVAARGHHADIGGIAPGSMPPQSRTVTDEGILIEDFLLVGAERLRAGEMIALLGGGPHPARNPRQNMEDLKAQIAACARGADGLRRIAGEQGRALVDAYMGHVQDQAEAAVRALIDRLEDGAFRCPLDNGAEIALAVRIDRNARRATFDFTGTSGQQDNNFNAPRAVVQAAVLYAIRTLIDEAIPMNEGCLRPIDIIVPPGSMLDPAPPAATVAGNVETSQLVTDTIFGALGKMAAAQGTMNNFTFGTERLQYYETIAGGAGAGSGFDGADAVQTHMTNSRLTDPEILETRFPVRLEEFRIRRGSGGAGGHHGGDGVVRGVRFLEPMHASILSGRRQIAPFGLAGGKDGTPGINRVIRANGNEDLIGPTASIDMAAGDVFEIETPGGGGFGEP